MRLLLHPRFGGASAAVADRKGRQPLAHAASGPGGAATVRVVKLLLAGVPSSTTVDLPVSPSGLEAIVLAVWREHQAALTAVRKGCFAVAGELAKPAVRAADDILLLAASVGPAGEDEDDEDEDEYEDESEDEGHEHNAEDEDDEHDDAVSEDEDGDDEPRVVRPRLEWPGAAEADRGLVNHASADGRSALHDACAQGRYVHLAASRRPPPHQPAPPSNPLKRPRGAAADRMRRGLPAQDRRWQDAVRPRLGRARAGAAQQRPRGGRERRPAGR